MAGGVALNSVANERLMRETPFEEVYIQPSAGDGGGALGAVLYAWHRAMSNKRGQFVMDHAYLGQVYGPADIKHAIKAAGFSAQHVDDPVKLIDITVDRLESGSPLSHARQGSLLFPVISLWLIWAYAYLAIVPALPFLALSGSLKESVVVLPFTLAALYVATWGIAKIN